MNQSLDPAPAMLSVGFADLSELRAKHARLVKEPGAAEPSPEFLDEVERFLICAQATGRTLEEDDDRVSAQTIIDYWGTVLLRARRRVPEVVARGLAEFAAPSPTTSLRTQSVSEYLSEERSAIRNRLRLSAAAAQWNERGRHSSLLWGGGQLVEAKSYPDLSDVEKAFVREGHALERKARLIKRTLLGAAFASLAAITLLLWFANRATKHALAVKLVERAGVSAREGDVAGSLLWLVEALRTDTQAGQPEEIHRVRLGAAIAQLPKLTQMLIEPNPDLICTSVEFTPDGKSVLTVANRPDSASGVARLWDTATGQKLADFPSPDGRLNRAVISTAGRIFTASGQSGTKRGGARIWDRSGKQLAGFEDLQNPVLDAVFSPAGDRVALIRESEDGSATVEVRETVRGVAFTGPLHLKPDSKSLAKSVAFSPDGDFVVACGSADGKGAVRVWSAWDGTDCTVEPYPAHTLPVNAALFSPDSTPAGARLATASGKIGAEGRGEIQMWNPFTGARQFVREQPSQVSAIAFSPDSRRIVSIGQDDTARVWDANAGTALTELSHESTVMGARYSPDGRFIITSSRDQTARIWRASNGDPALPPLYLGRTVSAPSFSPDGTLAVASAPDAACIWRVETGEPPAQVLKLEDALRLAALSADGSLAVAVSESGEVQTWNLKTNERTRYKDWRPDEARALFCSPDARLMLLAFPDEPGAPEFQVEVWRTQEKKRVSKLPAQKSLIGYAAFSGDGKYLLIADEGVARIWDVATGEPVGKPLEVSGTVGFAVFSKDSAYVLTASGATEPRNGQARVWKTATGEPATDKMSHLEAVQHASFSAQLDRVVTGSADDTAIAWRIDLAKGTATSENKLEEHSADLTHASFCPKKGSLAVTTSYDRMAVLWDTSTNERRAVLQHPGWINDASFSDDGRFLVTAGADGTARVWEAESGDFVALLRHSGEVKRALFTPEGDVATLSFYQPARTLVDSQRELLASGGAANSPTLRVSGARQRFAKAQIWRLPAEKAALPELEKFSRLVRSRQVDEARPRDLLRFKRSELGALWAHLRNGYFARVTGASGSAEGLRAVEESEASGEWSSAKWHLDRLILAEPDNAGLRKRRAVTSAYLRQWAGSVEDYTSALKDTPTDSALLLSRAEAFAELQQWPDAIRDTTAALAAAPDDSAKAASHRRRAGAHVAQGDWNSAAADLSAAIEKRPGVTGSYRRLAALRLKQGLPEDYRKLCEQMIAKFKGTELAASAAWPCALGPDLISDMEQFVQPARNAMAKAPDRYVLHNTLGAILYRAGYYAEAIEALNRSRKGYTDAINLAQALGESDLGATEGGASIESGRPQDWVFLAMAYAKIGRPDRAAYWYEKLESRPRDEASAPSGDRVWDWLEIEILHDEARGMAEIPKPAAVGELLQPGVAAPGDDEPFR